MLAIQYLVRVDSATDRDVKRILNTYNRDEYPTKTHLLRAALELGLKELEKKDNG